MTTALPNPTVANNQTAVWEKVKRRSMIILSPTAYSAMKQQETQRMVIASNEALEAQRQATHIKEMQLQYLMSLQRENNLAKRDQFNRDFQAQQATLNHEHQRELATFRANVDLALQNKNQEFQIWCLEQQRDLQIHLSKLNADLQRELRQYDRDAERKKLEEHKKINNSPIWPVASQILGHQTGTRQPPLRVFFAPPEVSQDRSSQSSILSHFPRLSEYLTEELRDTFNAWQEHGREIDFLDGAWQNRFYRGAAAAASLFDMLKSEPTLIIDSYVEGENFYLRIAYWGSGYDKFRYKTTLNISWRELLDQFAKNRVINWLEARNSWISKGKRVEDFDKCYLNDTLKKLRANSETLERENFALAEGIPLEPNRYPYQWLQADYEDLKSFLSSWHSIVASLIVDEYFLVDVPVEQRLTPLLSSMLPSLLQRMPQDVSNEVVHMVANAYQAFYGFLEMRESSFKPELRLALAKCLVALPDKSYANTQWLEAIRAWIVQRGREAGHDEQAEALLLRMGSLIHTNDRPFLLALQDYLKYLPDDENQKITVMLEKFLELTPETTRKVQLFN